MSDRIAVFNSGRIEQVASPSELYEAPATSFVAGFVGTSNLLEGEAARALFDRSGTFSIRPEKIHLGDELVESAAAPHRATGTVRDVIYLGSVNHYVVELAAGHGTATSLTVLRQNQHGASDRDVVSAGESVTLTWAAEHVIDLTHARASEGAVPSAATINPEEN